MTHFVMTNHLVMGRESGDIVDRRTFVPGPVIRGIGYLGQLWTGPLVDLPTGVEPRVVGIISVGHRVTPTEATEKKKRKPTEEMTCFRTQLREATTKFHHDRR